MNASQFHVMSYEESILECVETVNNEFDSIDILSNNAGIDIFNGKKEPEEEKTIF